MLCTIFHTGLVTPQWHRLSMGLVPSLKQYHLPSVFQPQWKVVRVLSDNFDDSPNKLEREKKTQYIWESIGCSQVTISIVSLKHLLSLVSASALPFRNGLNPARSPAEGYISLSLPEHDIAGADRHRRKQQQWHSRQGPRSPSRWSLSIAVYLQMWLRSNSPGDISSFYSSTRCLGCQGRRHRAHSGGWVWKQKSI